MKYRISAGLHDHQLEDVKKAECGRVVNTTWIIGPITEGQFELWLSAWPVTEFRWFNISQVK